MCDLTGATFVTSIVSGPTPQSGQKNRSSNNFSTKGAPSNSTLIWVVQNNASADNISFNVMEDKSVSHDPTIFSDVHNCNKTKDYSSGSLYISNPEGAGGQNFTVSVYYI